MEGPNQNHSDIAIDQYFDITKKWNLTNSISQTIHVSGAGFQGNVPDTSGHHRVHDSKEVPSIESSIYGTE